MAINKSNKLLVRADLNVPIRNGKVLDNFRIIKALTNIEQLKKISKNITKEERIKMKKLVDEQTRKFLGYASVKIKN